MKLRVGLISAGFLFLISFVDKPALAGPWTQEKGSLYINYSSVWTKFDSVRLFNGNRKYVGNVRTLSHDFLMKYGVLENLDVHIQAPYELASIEGDPTATSRGFGDGSLGVQYRFLRENENFPVSAAVGFEWKTPLSSYRDDKLSSLGDHNVDYEYRFLVGRYFDVFQKTSYINVEGGYRTRTGKPADEVFGFGEVGMLFTPKVAGRIFVDGVDALGGSELWC